MGAMAEGAAAAAAIAQQQQQHKPAARDDAAIRDSAVTAKHNSSFPSQNGFSHHPFSQNTILHGRQEEAEEEEEVVVVVERPAAAAGDVAAGPHQHLQRQQQQQEVAGWPVVVGLQPMALVDHVAKVDWSLLEAVPGERGGSMRVTAEELDHILAEVNTQHTLLPVSSSLEQQQQQQKKHQKQQQEQQKKKSQGEAEVESAAMAVRTLAGGSVANTIRGLAGGFGIRTSLVGVRGDDERGQMFAANMRKSGVDLSRLREVRGSRTAQCACLVDTDGNRTMRPCFLNAAGLKADELSAKEDFRGAQWLVLNGYGFYGPELLETVVRHAKQEGVRISMDLASFEVVRNFRHRLMTLLRSGDVDLVFANEDEAHELLEGLETTETEAETTKTTKTETAKTPSPAAAAELCVGFLAKYCERAVVMLGAKGCVARHGAEMVRVAAVRETAAAVVDTTGAGDLFASGFLYGILSGMSLEDCCNVGCCAGGAVVRGLGGEVAEEGWQWMQRQLVARQLPPIRRYPVNVS